MMSSLHVLKALSLQFATNNVLV